MMIKTLGKYYFIIVLVSFTACKFSHLFLPYFWDEAWSYFPAIARMTENGPGLLPGALSLDEAKGHPLFFFFLTSSWISIHPGSIFFSRLLPLFISLAVLFYAYHFSRKTAGIAAGNLVITLLAVQSLFLAQATFLLPEMLLALFLLISTERYLSGKFLHYAGIASLMILTKETAVVFILFFMAWHILTNLDLKRKKPVYALDILLLTIPLLIYVIYLLLHYLKFGTFFYSEHVGHIQIDKYAVLHKLETALKILFLQQGRWIISAAVLISLAFPAFTGKKPENLRLLVFFLCMTILFILFSAFNFYTQRYMLGLMVLFIVTAGVVISQVRRRRWLTESIAAALLAAIPLYSSLTHKHSADSDLGFVEVTRVHREMVKFCEQNGWQNDTISSSFNMIFNLRDKRLGYLYEDQPFTNVGDRKNLKSARIFITESTSPEPDETMNYVKEHFPMHREFRDKHAFGLIFYKPK